MIAAFWAPSTIPGHNDSSSTALIVFQASKLVSVLINCSHCVPEHLCDSQVDLFPGLSPILTVGNNSTSQQISFLNNSVYPEVSPLPTIIFPTFYFPRTTLLQTTSFLLHLYSLPLPLLLLLLTLWNHPSLHLILSACFLPRNLPSTVLTTVFVYRIVY